MLLILAGCSTRQNHSDIVTGKKPGREGDELIVCDLTGVGAQDAAIAELAYKKLGS